ncbi:MAG: aminoacyl-tRNA hydrolase [Eggerthellaceae bacterium]|nr:aminoacyl-tRNA hydrolase [Eggerthellaceae bacterium]
MVVGLGNPGPEYEGTRHNAGFLTVMRLAEEANATFWKDECGAKTARGKLAGKDVLFAMPQSFMNTSGGPVSKLLSRYDVKPDELIVIHDELDIPPGTIRVKFGGGHAGHNGLRSICDKLGTRDWYRVRIGIGRPPGRMPVADYVLKRPRGEEEELFEEACALGAEAVPYLMEHGLERTQGKFN